MLNAFLTSPAAGIALEPLGDAIEAAIAAVGIGTAVALLLGALVFVVEALIPRLRKSARKRPRPRSSGRRREAHR